MEVGDRVGFAREEGGESRESEEGGYGGGDTWWQSRGGRSELGAGHGGGKGDEDRMVVGVGRRGRDRSRIGLVLTCLRRNVTSRRHSFTYLCKRAHLAGHSNVPEARCTDLLSGERVRVATRLREQLDARVHSGRALALAVTLASNIEGPTGEQHATRGSPGPVVNTSPRCTTHRRIEVVCASNLVRPSALVFRSLSLLLHTHTQALHKHSCQLIKLPLRAQELPPLVAPVAKDLPARVAPQPRKEPVPTLALADRRLVLVSVRITLAEGRARREGPERGGRAEEY